jgi:hypothetical protein
MIAFSMAFCWFTRIMNIYIYIYIYIYISTVSSNIGRNKPNNRKFLNLIIKVLRIFFNILQIKSSGEQRNPFIAAFLI